MTRIWCNGQWQDGMDFSVAPQDRGLMHGLGLFETILAMDGVPIFACQHLARLRDGCARLGWRLPMPHLQEVMMELIALNDLGVGRARIRLAISAGSGSVHHLALGEDHVMWMFATPVAEPPLMTTVNLSPWVRNERSALAGLKCASYAENLIALEYSARLGFGETVFLNSVGNLCEAATSNVFVVKDGAVFTPSLQSGCLPGITRKIVLKLALQWGIRCTECDLSFADIVAADEIFLTSSIRGLMGVSQFQEQRFESGPVTQVLREAWEGVLRQEVRQAETFCIDAGENPPQSARTHTNQPLCHAP